MFTIHEDVTGKVIFEQILSTRQGVSSSLNILGIMCPRNRISQTCVDTSLEAVLRRVDVSYVVQKFLAGLICLEVDRHCFCQIQALI